MPSASERTCLLTNARAGCCRRGLMLVWQKGATLRGTGERTRDRQIWLRISPGRVRMGEDGEVCDDEDIVGDGLFLKVLVLVMELCR